MAIVAAMAVLAMAFGANTETNLKAKLEKYPEIREAICTVGVEALEDNGINFEALKKVPKDKVVMGLRQSKIT